MADITIVDRDEIVERQFATIADRIGTDLTAYRNHVYRVLTYALHFLGHDTPYRKPVAFALVYHDAGMWTDGTLAYLGPSEAAAEQARRRDAPDLDATLLRDIIHWHHKITAYHGPHAQAVNAVRKADWIDASGGKLRKGLSKAQVGAVERAIPIAGFPETLMRLAADLNHGRRLGGLWRVVTRVYKF